MNEELLNEHTLTTEDFELIDNLFENGFKEWLLENIGVTTIKHSYKLFNNESLINSGFTKAPSISLFLDTEYFDIIEVIYYFGIDYLYSKNIVSLLNESKRDYIGEIILEKVGEYIEVYPMGDLA